MTVIASLTLMDPWANFLPLAPDADENLSSPLGRLSLLMQEDLGNRSAVWRHTSRGEQSQPSVCCLEARVSSGQQQRQFNGVQGALSLSCDAFALDWAAPSAPREPRRSLLDPPR